MKIIIADDELDSCSLLNFQLKKTNIPFEKIFMVYNGEDFIKIFEEKNPDLCFVDIKMPLFSGFEAIKSIKRKNPKKDVSFYIISGYEEFDFAIKAMRLGIVDYLLKPIRPVQIKEIMETEIRRIYLGIDTDDISSSSQSEEQVEELCNYIMDIEDSYQKNDFFRFQESLETWYTLASALQIRLNRQYLEQAFQISEESHNLDSQYRQLQSRSNYISDAEEMKNCMGKTIVEFIRRNFNKCDMNLEYLSDVFHVSPSYLGFLLRNEVGLKFNSFLTEIRITKSKEYLEKTDMKIKDVSANCGFNNPSYFIRIFRAHVGKTPINYRKTNQNC